MKAVNKFYVFDIIISLKYEAMQITIFSTYFAQMSHKFCVDPLLIDQPKGRNKTTEILKILIVFFIFLSWTKFGSK